MDIIVFGNNLYNNVSLIYVNLFVEMVL